jgi:predicted phosphodiesterase
MAIRRMVVLVMVVGLLVVPVGCGAQENQAPVIASPAMVEATGGIRFVYHAAAIDMDCPTAVIAYHDYPSWLTADGDSIFGTPPDGGGDTSFVVLASDGLLADTAAVTIRMIPCLAVIGDTRTNHQIHRSLVDSIVALKPAAVFHTGDLVEDGTQAAQWDTFNVITAQMRASAEFYPALGNHEKQSQLYFDNFVLPHNEQWYSVDRLNTHFIILNSCVPGDTASEQYQWLKSDLAGVSDTIRFIVVVFHHPPYSTSRHAEDEKGLRQTWVPLFEQYGVDVVFNGHDHCYERSWCGGRYYIISGGGGAPLYDQSRQHPCSQLYLKTYQFCKLSIVGRRMIVKTYDASGQLIDQFEIDNTTPSPSRR